MARRDDGLRRRPLAGLAAPGASETLIRPLVSVIVCSRGRGRFLRKAIRSVLCQDMEDLELVLVEAGRAPGVPVPGRRGIEVKRVFAWRRTPGAARAAGLAAATGELIAYCDDDDEWLPNHLSVLLRALKDHPGATLAYGDSRWRYNIRKPDDVPYSFSYDPWTLTRANYIFATDVLHRAQSAREAGGFDPGLASMEDWDLWLRMSQHGRFIHVPRVLSLHRWHESCVSVKRERMDAGRVGEKNRGLIRRICRAVPPRFDKSTWHRGHRELIWFSHLQEDSGFGRVGLALARALQRVGVKIIMAPLISRSSGPADFSRAFERWDHWGRIGFFYHFIPKSTLPCARLVRYTMWESSALPRGHVASYNHDADLLYVPCRQNAEDFKRGGVRPPIKVLHHAVDPRDFPLLSRPRRTIFTFGTFGYAQARKGTDVLIRAFRDAFANGERARLIILMPTEPDSHLVGLTGGDSRIVFRARKLGQAGLLRFLKSLDAFVLPSRGEGFGLCGLEAMSTGLPLIATDWSGPSEYLDPSCTYPLRYVLRNPQHNAWHRRELVSKDWTFGKFSGRWAEPSLAHLRELMRHLFENPEEARRKGRLAAALTRRRWTWRRVALQVRRDLDELAARRP